MNAKQINDLKKKHNALQDQGREAYAKVLSLHEQCVEIQKILQREEGEEYDAIPLIFGDGFWIDPDLEDAQ